MFGPEHITGHEDGGTALAAKMAKVKVVAADGDHSTHITATDTNGDGQINVDDCPYPMGSAEAKTWLRTVLDPTIKNQANIPDAMKAKYGDKISGMYNGKPLVAGVKGSAEEPQGDFDYMSDKIRLSQGVEKVVADKIAAKVMYSKFPPVK